MSANRIAAIGFVAMLALGGSVAWGRPPEIGLLEPAQSIRDNLRRLAQKGKRVELLLKNGKSYKGKLGSVGDHAVVVTEIEGREFFDALLLLDEIAAIEVRVRDR